MEHLRVVDNGGADSYDPQVAATTVADLGVPDCDSARRLHVDLTSVVDTAAVFEEVVFLASAEERLLAVASRSVVSGEQGHGWLASLRTAGPVAVVVVQVAVEGLAPLLVGRVEGEVGPLVFEGEVEALDLAVGLGAIRAGAPVGDAVIGQQRIPATDDGLDESHEPVVVGMLLLETVGHLRSLHRSDVVVYDPHHLATVGRALRSPMWVPSELLRTKPEA